MLASHHPDSDSPPLGSWCWKRGKRMPDQDNSYLLPKDPLEGERLNLQHRLLREGLGANVLAPVERPARILDVAGGTGIWAREVARQFPRSLVETFDKDPLPLEEALKRLKAHWPGNCTFRPHSTDALAVWPYPDAFFDYTHVRYISPFVPRERWPHIISEMLRVTRPGGWVEIVESPLPTCAAPGYQEIAQAIIQLAQRRLGIYHTGPHLSGWLAAAGALEVTEAYHRLGAGEDARAVRLSALVAEDLFHGFESIGPVLQEAGLLTETRFAACMDGLLPRMQAARMFLPVWVVYGQKPGKEAE